MKRREFIAGLGAAAAWPVTRVRAQQSPPMRRLAVLVSYPEGDTTYRSWIAAVLTELQALGWVKGRNIGIDVLWAGPNAESIQRDAKKIVNVAPDVIFATPHGSVDALHQLTRTLPIIAVQSGDFVGAGYAQSLARPRGNVTGFALFEETINTKYVQLLKEIAPHLSRVGIVQSEGPAWRGDSNAIAAAARSFEVEPTVLLIKEAAEIEGSITKFANTPNGGLVIPPDGFISSYRKQIIALAEKLHLPTMWNSRAAVADGGLIRYGTDFIDVYRRSASYIDRVIRGEKPSDLPIQQPTSYQLIINLKTANALGLTVPETLLATADEVIQ
jgi:putative tryptophan/tyrosine transport system substrate-binding protein